MQIPINIDTLPHLLSAERYAELLALTEAGKWVEFSVQILENGNPDRQDAHARCASLWADIRRQLGLGTDLPTDH